MVTGTTMQSVGKILDAGNRFEFDDSGKANITKTTIPGTTTQSTGTEITPIATTPTTTTNDNDNSDVTPAPGSLSRFGSDSVVTTVRGGGLSEPTEIGSGSVATDRVGNPGVVPATTTITLGTILEDHRVFHQVPSCRPPPGLDIAAVTVCAPCGPQEPDNSEWSLMSGSRWRAMQKQEER